MEINGFLNLKNGHTNTDGLKRYGLPKRDDEKFTKSFWQTIKLQEVADTLKTSRQHVSINLHEHLSIDKLFSDKVPHLLTMDQKAVWIHHYTPDST